MVAETGCAGVMIGRRAIEYLRDQVGMLTQSGLAEDEAFLIAVTNLVRNAFEHTLAGQGPITILIKEHELLVTNQVSTSVTNQESAHERHTPTEASLFV